MSVTISTPFFSRFVAGALLCFAAGACSKASTDPDAGSPASDAGNPPSDAGLGRCSRSADCASSGEYSVCRNAKCVSLLSNECTTVSATSSPASTAFRDDEALIIGSILPTQGPDAPSTKLIEDSITLALDDFAPFSGIPSAADGGIRPLVLVACNDGPNEAMDARVRAAQHLVDDLGVPAIIGYADSAGTLEVANLVTVPKGVLLFSPSATSADITSFHAHDMGLVWRTAPSDNVQAQALARYLANVQAASLRKYPMIDSANVRVAIVNHSDSYGSSLGDALENLLVVNGLPAAQAGANYLRVNYGPSYQPDLTKLASLMAFAPHIVFVLGFDEGPDIFFKGAESMWTPQADGHRPFWVFSDGGDVSRLWSSTLSGSADIQTEDARQRVSGTRVASFTPSAWPPMGAFLSSFSAKYPNASGADALGPAGAYDILYLLAYSAVLAGNHPLTGPNLVTYGLTQMKKTAGLASIQIGPTGIAAALTQLAKGMPVNVTGASGPLPFDGKGDVQTWDVQIWCVPPAMPPGGDVGSAAVNSGLFFDSTMGQLAGSIGGQCGFP